MFDLTHDIQDLRNSNSSSRSNTWMANKNNKTIGPRLQLETSDDVSPEGDGAVVRSLAMHWDIFTAHDDSFTRAESDDSLSALNALLDTMTDINSINLTGYPYASLPKQIANLKHTLKTLTIDKSIRLKDISEIATLTNLETLTISQCDTLEMLPSEIGCLTKLEKLRLCLCNNLHTLPAEMGLLQNLKTFEIDTCQSLQRLPMEMSKLQKLELLELEYFDLFAASSSSSRDDDDNLRSSPSRKRQKQQQQQQQQQQTTDCSDDLVGNSCCCPPPTIPFERDELQDFLESSFPMIIRGASSQTHQHQHNQEQQHKMVMIPPELKYFSPKQLRLCGFQRDAIFQFFECPWEENGKPETISIYRCSLGGDYSKIFPGLPKSLVVLELYGLIDDLEGFTNARLPRGIQRLSIDYNPSFPYYYDNQDDQKCLLRLLQEHPLLSQISCRAAAHRTRNNNNNNSMLLFTAESKYQMLLNRCGRVLLCSNESKKIPLALWPTVLEKVRGEVRKSNQHENGLDIARGDNTNNVAIEADILFGLLRGPALLSRPEGYASLPSSGIPTTTRKRKR